MTVLIAMLTTLSAQPGAEFLDQHDPVWETAPARWLDGVPLANGHIGAMVWGAGRTLRFTLDKYDAWETREPGIPPDHMTYAKLREYVEKGMKEEATMALRNRNRNPANAGLPYPTRLPMPRVEFRMPEGSGPGEPFCRLSLRRATATFILSVAGQPATLEAFTHADQNVLVLRFSGEQAAGLRPRIGLDHLNDDAKNLLESWGYPEPVIEAQDTRGSFHMTAPTGYEYAIAWERAPAPDGAGQTICLALLSNKDAADPLAAAVKLAGEACRNEGARTAHEQWWAEYWDRSFLTLPDARFEALYYIEMYKLGACSRPGGYPITLQGLWTLDGGMPPWQGDYHLDMNVQQTYWPIYTANRLDLGEPLYRVFSDCIPRWREQCQRFFGFDGIWSGCAIGPNGERIYGYTGVELWPGNAAWLAHHYWLHWRYSQDLEFLRTQALPMIRLAFLTYANLLEKGEGGKLHVPLSNSPEWGEGSFSSFVKDPNCDLALIRWLGSAILEANEALSAEDDITPRVHDVLENLTGYPREGPRLNVAAGVPITHSHRHHSHLMGIHPLGIINRDGSKTERDLIHGSLYRIRQLGPGEWTGWAFPWMALIAARAGYGNTTWQMLDAYANSFIRPNTLHINGDPRIFGLSMFSYDPMTLEAGFGAAAAMMEMMLQSFGGIIRVFPAMPARWHDAYFRGLRAEGAFLVTAKLEQGEVCFIDIVSEKGGICRVLNPFGEEVAVTHAGATVLPIKYAAEAYEDPAMPGANLLTFTTEPGKRYRIHAESDVDDGRFLTPVAFDRLPDEQHFYGTKKLPRF